MPTYEYVCTDCGEEHEVFQRMSEDPLTICPSCEEPKLKRKIGLGAGILFKGGGFYETDFKDRKGKPEAKGETKPAEAKGGEAAGKEASSKPETKKAEPAAAGN